MDALELSASLYAEVAESVPLASDGPKTTPDCQVMAAALATTAAQTIAAAMSIFFIFFFLFVFYIGA
jgi:hypothetical protein